MYYFLLVVLLLEFYMCLLIFHARDHCTTIFLIMPHRFTECAVNVGRCLDIFLHVITFARAMSISTYLAPR
jgi:hypothetical protein